MSLLKVVNQNPLTGGIHTMEMDIARDVFDHGIREWNKGALIQYAFPMLSDDEREFIMTGHTPETWNQLFGEEE